jgi:flagellar biosynthesis/type III secretory pathway protein FliH
VSAARIIRGDAPVGAVDLPPVDVLVRGEGAELVTQRLLEEAERRGEARGRAQARAELEAELGQARAEVEARRATLDAVLERLGRLEREVLEADASEVITLALELAREVLAAEVVLPRERVETWVRRVVAEHGAAEFTVRVAPALRDQVASLLIERAAERGALVHVEADEALEPYDVVVELSAGVLDLTVRGAFERVLQELRELGR